MALSRGTDLARTTILAVAAFALLSGCNGSLSDFVKGTERVRLPAVADVSIPAGPPILKRSPGAVVSAGTGSSMEATVTPTRGKFVGSSVSAEIGVGRSSSN